ncbi:MAG: hypothetical protein P0Y63_14365 [Klebsiella huaxiensis]|uniref:hypothetical protein n=1 Tax=Klebsiella huaxiensis TaxID=2153354 RepID=UPI0026EE8F1F|nr:hypothetical protein [Klebsiella huaxiensis]WEJ92126.1 MAG: hypothetical protein P0Y63_14365 [Klebsiella huaxiensis]
MRQVDALEPFLPGGAALTGLRVYSCLRAGSPDRRGKRRLRGMRQVDASEPFLPGGLCG